MSAKEVVAVAAPSWGPAAIVLFDVHIPIFSTGLAIAGLVLASYIAPPPKEPLTRSQRWALTALLAIILVAALVSVDLGPGTAVGLGIGLGSSGMLAIQFFRGRVRAALTMLFGSNDTPR